MHTQLAHSILSNVEFGGPNPDPAMVADLAHMLHHTDHDYQWAEQPVQIFLQQMLQGQTLSAPAAYLDGLLTGLSLKNYGPGDWEVYTYGEHGESKQVFSSLEQAYLKYLALESENFNVQLNDLKRSILIMDNGKI